MAAIRSFIITIVQERAEMAVAQRQWREELVFCVMDSTFFVGDAVNTTVKSSFCNENQ
jgi:hypothetical protein